MAYNLTELNELKAANLQWYLGLLPSGRLPVQGNDAEKIISTFSGFITELEAEILRVYLESLAVEAQDTALNIIGESRGIFRYPNESLAEFRVRVLGSYFFWSKAGTLGGLAIALEQLGYRCNIIEHYKDEPTKWSEFTITIYPQAKTYDGSANELQRVLGIIREIKPAHTKLRRLFYSDTGTIYGINANKFGAGLLYGGASTLLYESLT